MEREDRHRRDFMMYKLMGLEREKRSIKKQIKVQMISCDSHNPVLPTKMTVNYTGTGAVCMAEDAVGVALEADGETVIITNTRK